MRLLLRSAVMVTTASSMLCTAACTEEGKPRRVVPTSKRPAPGPDFSEPPSSPDERRARLLEHYDTSNAQIDLEQLLAPGPDKDGIPSLTDPKRVKAADAEYPPDDARIVAVEIDGESVAYPLLILNYHEIANDTVGDVPIAATYCPLCDSVSVLDRRFAVEGADGTKDTITLEFGVSGLLYNSNVVMYERRTKTLWSQVYMQAVTGPHAGGRLTHLPVEMMTFGEFREKHPEGEVLSKETGHDRDYDKNPYRRYFESPDRLFGTFTFGDALPAKTLGLGVRAGDFTTFITAERAREGKITVATPKGDVVVSATDAGLKVEQAPEGVTSLQTFYHSWSAFFPETQVVK